MLTGINYLKGKADLVAKADEEYPEWLWNCLEVQKKSGDEADAGAGDEFCTSRPFQWLLPAPFLACSRQILALTQSKQPSQEAAPAGDGSASGSLKPSS